MNDLTRPGRFGSWSGQTGGVVSGRFSSRVGRPPSCGSDALLPGGGTKQGGPSFPRRFPGSVRPASAAFAPGRTSSPAGSLPGGSCPKSPNTSRAAAMDDSSPARLLPAPLLPRPTPVRGPPRRLRRGPLPEGRRRALRLLLRRLPPARPASSAPPSPTAARAPLFDQPPTGRPPASNRPAPPGPTSRPSPTSDA